ncbi:unnamed protein product [Parascedosporium putredinis]|uniref:DUF7728 domain-containing protein n=1 Tax=Parascedosporium putredinis TaxID=1442378 RepID=A0A9P1GUT4_9PEZI|nr:unnamed protein product [Parascedosporium putredinis]CAI7988042.1 unnamed protein product [Parascedosporium putredinis]
MLGKSVLTAGLAATAAQAFVVIPIADADRAISDLLPFDAPPGRGTVPELDDVQEPVRTKVQQLGYKFHVYPIAKEEEGQHLELIGVDLSIIEVGGSFVKGIPEVKVQLVKNGDRLAIAEVVTESPRLPDFGAHCTTLFCKWKAFFTERMAMLGRPGASCHDDDASPPDSHDPPFRPPHGRPHGRPHGGPPLHLPAPSRPLGMPHGIPPHHPAMSPGGFHEGQFPHPGPFHHGPPGHRHHGLSHVFFMFLTHILLPILTGIIAGITASLIGMALVSLVVRVFNADPAEAIMSEEKAGLIQEEDDDVEPPPSYSDDATPASK